MPPRKWEMTVAIDEYIMDRFDKIDARFDEYKKQLFIMNETLGEIKNQLTHTNAYKRLIGCSLVIVSLMLVFTCAIFAIVKYILLA